MLGLGKRESKIALPADTMTIAITIAIFLFL